MSNRNKVALREIEVISYDVLYMTKGWVHYDGYVLFKIRDEIYGLRCHPIFYEF